MRLAVKITTLVLVLGILFAAASITINQFLFQKHLSDAQTEWVKTLKQAIAEGISLDTINGNAIHAREQLQTIIQQDVALEYAYITDFDGNLFAHTFDQGFPRYLLLQLEKRNPSIPLQFNTTNGLINDTASPLIEGMRANLHIGINQKEINRLIDKVNIDIIWLSLLITFVGTGIAAFLGKHITKPLAQLSTWMNLYGKGNDQYKLNLDTSDTDIKNLIRSFNTMIEDRSMLETELKESEAFNRLLVESLPLGLALNNMDGSFINVNPAFSDIIGRDIEDILKMNYWKITPEKYFEDEKKQLQILEKTGNYGPYEKEYIHADGHLVPVKLQGKLIQRNGKTFIWSLAEDITRQKQQDEQLRRSQKMDALGKLTSGIAHDYNNMLSIILGYSELLELALKDQPKLTNYSKNITHAGERGVSLTKKLLAFSKKTPSESKTLNINNILENSKNLLEKTLTARIQLNYKLDNNLWSSHLDTGDLEDAILNISINAMHAIPGTGKLTFETKNETISEIDAKQLQLPAGDYILLIITDTGSGMNKETRDKVFDPFFTTKGDKGTGLGLSQVYGFVKRSNGSIKIYSEPGHGTRLNLYLPRSIENKNETEQPDITKNHNVSGQETILIVDDEPELTKLTQEILESKGYNTLTSGSAYEALDLLKLHTVDLILSDIIMPDMDGYQLASAVQQQYPDIKIQLASGFSDDRHKNMVDTTLQENLLAKPFHSSELLKRVRELLDNH